MDSMLVKDRHDNGFIVSFQEPCHIVEQFQLLQSVLAEMGLPPMVDRRDHPRSDELHQNAITVVLLAEVAETVNVFLEGNRQCPDGVMLVLSSRWLSRDPSPNDPNLDTLYLHQAVTAGTSGQTYFDVFRPPQRVSYLVNQLLRASTGFRRNDGEKLSAFGLDTPCSSSPLLLCRMYNKLLNTNICAAAGVGHPVTLGFWLPGMHSFDNSCDYPDIRVILLASQDQDSLPVQSIITDFLGSSAMKDYEKVVVRPFCCTCNCCQQVTVHDKSNVTGVVQTVLHHLNSLQPDSGILVQSHHLTFEPVVSSGLGRHNIHMEEINLGFHVRAIIARTPKNDAAMTQVFCGINDADIPMNKISPVPKSLELTLQQWGVTDISEQKRIRDSVRQNSEILMLEFMRQEAKLTAKERGGHGCQTDLLGIEIILTKQKDTIVPVVIDVIASNSLYKATLMECMDPQKKRQSVAPLVYTMVARSQRFLMAGKVLLVIGAGGFSNMTLWQETRNFGVKIVLVDSNKDHPARSEVDMLLHVDIEDHTQDKQHAATIVARLAAQLPFIKVDGCLAFCEDFMPLAALVGEALNLEHCPSYQSVLCATSKEWTHRLLQDVAQKRPHELRASVYACPQVKMENISDVDEAIEKIPLPAVMKPEYGSKAVGIKLVHSVQEVKKHMQQVHSKLQGHSRAGLGYAQSLVLMPFLLGSEHDVNVIIFEGKLMGAFLSDSGPTHLPLCMRTSAVMPSVLRKEEQQLLVSAAVTCCRGLGLHTGVFNVEMMMTPRGPRLIEVNARMGGFYLRDWILLVHQVDLLHLTLMCACGICPVFTCKETNKEPVGDNSEIVLMGIMLYPSRHHQPLETTATLEHLQQLHAKGVVILTQLQSKVDHNRSGCFDEPCASLAVKASSLEEARSKLISECTSLGLETEDSLREILRDFIRLG